MNENKYGAYPQTEEEFIEYVRKAIKPEYTDPSDGYNKAAEALVNVAVAAFNYACHVNGVTGFQAGWAELQFLAVTRGLKGPFGIVDGEKMLYPQYDLLSDVAKWLEEWKPTIGKIAKERLASENYAHPDVIKRWQEMAQYAQ